MVMDEWWENAIVVGVVVVALSLIIHRIQDSQPQLNHTKISSAERSAASAALAQALPDSVFFGPHPIFVESIQSYWAIQERDIVPQCIVRPRTVEEAATAIRILKHDYDARIRQGDVPSHFAVRSGGHSPIPGAANINGGIVIDLRLLDEVVPSKDGSSVVIGTGARWLDVSKTLDKMGLAVAGGRNSAVGVGGLTLGGKSVVPHYTCSFTSVLAGELGLVNSVPPSRTSRSDTLSGGLSFFSPRVGFVCNNILSYEIVLANGTRAIASELINPELWRALKGGSNNFGIVTSFVARSFPTTNIWSGFLYMTSSKASQVIRTFYNFTEAKPDIYDEYAAGPLVCFSYLQKLGIQVIATHLVYTKSEEWPACFAGFKSIGRLWSTVKIRSLTSATNELEMSSPPGLRCDPHSIAIIDIFS